MPVDEYMENLPDSRLKRQLKRLKRLHSSGPKAGHRGGFTHPGSVALRSPRRKKGKYFAA